MKMYSSFMKMYIYFAPDNSITTTNITEIVRKNQSGRLGVLGIGCLNQAYLSGGQVSVCKPAACKTNAFYTNELTMLEIPHDFFFSVFCS